jgi:pSer/pThr/pTyr-binding forkhead associated (FHA) protein
MAWRVRVVLDPAREDRADQRTVDFPDTVASIRIGRRKDLELPLRFRTLSGVHARITRNADGLWSVEDLGSLNGTSLDGVPLVPGQPRTLAAGSRIGFSAALVIFDGTVPEGPQSPTTGAEGTGTIARRLVNDLLGADSSAGAPTLTVVRGASPATLRLEVLGLRYVVGRSESAALRLLAPEISRVHFTLARDYEGVRMADLASKNGVYINGSRAHSQSLRDGDIIELGPVALRFSDPAARYQRELEALAEPAAGAAPPTDDLPPTADQGPEPPVAASPATRTTIVAAIILVLLAAIALAIAISG